MVFRGVSPSRKPCCTKRAEYNVKHFGPFLMRFWKCPAKRSERSVQNITVNPGYVVFLPLHRSLNADRQRWSGALR